mgnify:CR=1 FL=1
MAKAFDILLDDNGDLIIDNDDFKLGESDAQHIEDTIRAHPGWWKENFTDGVGISDYLNSSGNQQQLARNIKIQLQSDGYTVNNPKILIQGSDVTIDPNAIRN